LYKLFLIITFFNVSFLRKWGHSSVGRALEWHSRGRRFDPVWLHIMTYFVYILYSKSRKRFYTGHTKDINSRMVKHNNGYELSTKSGVPWELKFTEIFKSRSEAVIRESEIKSKKSRKYIECLINQK
jgi:putative endonuclease